MCSVGMTRMWVGACGLMSRNATTRSSRWTTSAGISPATILQKRQSIGLIAQAAWLGMIGRHASHPSDLVGASKPAQCEDVTPDAPVTKCVPIRHVTTAEQPRTLQRSHAPQGVIQDWRLHESDRGMRSTDALTPSTPGPSPLRVIATRRRALSNAGSTPDGCARCWKNTRRPFDSWIPGS